MINDENILTPQKNQASDDDDDDDKNDDEMMVIFFSDHMWISRKMGVYLEEEAPSLHAHAGQVSLNMSHCQMLGKFEYGLPAKF